jgi:hypothetical protein
LNPKKNANEFLTAETAENAEKNPFKKIKILSKAVGDSDPFCRCPVKRAGGEDKTGGRKPSLCPPPHFPKRDAGGKGWFDNKARKPASDQRGIAAFFGEPDALLPGQGTHVPSRQALKRNRLFIVNPK